MQGTVGDFDPQTRTGWLLLDDGRRIEFDREAFNASGLRLLRFGQRVHLDHDESGRLTRITLPTMRAQ
jgi:YD repeat-containing protein